MRILDKDVWKSTTADKYWSNWIRERDGKCLRCGKTEELECSHFFDRGVYVVRYDPDNCDTLCHWCHALWEDLKQADYRDFKMKQLGEERFEALVEKVKNYKMNPGSIKAVLVRKELMLFLHDQKDKKGN